MYTDMFGIRRIRLGLHQHTALSDGRCTPEEAARRYRDAGYDAIAITDHWVYSDTQILSGLPILSGCEYHVGASDSASGVYHIVCLCADRQPEISREMTPQQIIDGIHDAGGLAVLAHPAWSLNTPQMIKALQGIDAIEIYNTVSERGYSRRADASLILDMLASEGLYYPMLASDDAHYYEASGNFADACHAFIMAECETPEPDAIKKAISEGRFYASTGPEIHLKVQGSRATVDCSAANEIVFLSNFVFAKNRVITGENLNHAEYDILPGETFLRAFLTDADGNHAWSNCIRL